MCVFCEIINGNIPSEKVWEDELMVAFKDNAPAAPVHVLAVPRRHIESANCITGENSAIVAHIFEMIPKIAKSQGIDSYRIVNNCGKQAGQTVQHLHFHLLGGVEMGDKIL
ncbi:MAG: histidine triad nucleotide-binding protein [Clostridiales bacterium]|nr:histidine triad nucleotide-binding protein [Clostridiales bacterium]